LAALPARIRNNEDAQQVALWGLVSYFRLGFACLILIVRLKHKRERVEAQPFVFSPTQSIGWRQIYARQTATFTCVFKWGWKRSCYRFVSVMEAGLGVRFQFVSIKWPSIPSRFHAVSGSRLRFQFPALGVEMGNEGVHGFSTAS
jgi:hypothetical protein